MKKLLLLLLCAFALNVNAQELNKHFMDATRNQEILVNSCSRDGLTSFAGFKPNYDTNYANYKSDSLRIDSLKAIPKDYQLTVVLGTWCGDSKLQVPNLFKVLDQASIPTDNMQIIAVDGTKKVQNNSLDGLNITRVPTIIVRNKDGVEMGRITERPVVSLEADLLKIVSPKS